ncbi:MAG: ABC transporter permease [Nitrospirota bacterium]
MPDGNDKYGTVVYTPESQLRSPVQLLRTMGRDLLHARELGWRLFVRDTSARYRQSILGIFWSFVPPLVTGLVFIILQSKRIVNFGATDIPYPVFAMAGTMLWQLFTESLNGPLASVRGALPLLAKINFPREALILAAFYHILFSLAIKMTLLLGILLLFDIPLTFRLVPALGVIMMLIFLGMGIGLLLTPVSMLYTDISSLLAVAVQLGFFVTPVVYPPPTAFPYSLVTVVNPAGILLTAARDLMAKGALTGSAVPLLLVCLLTVLLLFGAWIVYRVALPLIIERMSS